MENQLSRESELRTDMTAVEQESKESKLKSVDNSVEFYQLLPKVLGLILNARSHLRELKSDLQTPDMTTCKLTKLKLSDGKLEKVIKSGSTKHT